MNDLIRPALYGAKHRIIPSKLNRKKISKNMNLLVQYVKLLTNF